jgi:hypothetical protein
MDDERRTSRTQAGRREFIKKTAYVAPAVLTLAVVPTYAKAGSMKGPVKKPETKPKPKTKKKD